MGSGKDQSLDPWIHLQRSQWPPCPKTRDVSNLNLMNPMYLSAMQILSTNVSPHGHGGQVLVPPGVDAPKQVILGDIWGQNALGNDPLRPCVSKFIPMCSAFKLPMTSVGTPPATSSHRKFIIFDRPGNRTRMMFGSVSPPVLKPGSSNIERKPPEFRVFRETVRDDPINHSDETSICGGNECDEMHEDTDEIDALLCSDSDDDEETSTGQSPVHITEAEEDVASSGVPTKRRRLNEDNDPLLMDTASSATISGRQNICRIIPDGDAELSQVMSTTNQRTDNDIKMRLKKNRIHETLGILQHIIPGGVKGKDASVVLEEAIVYLKYLKAKAFEGGL